MDSVLAFRGATYFLGASEWLFGALLFAGFWNKNLGIFGALGKCFSMISTSTIIPFMPDGWAASASEFPAMTERVAFLMKVTVLSGVSFYLLRQQGGVRLVHRQGSRRRRKWRGGQNVRPRFLYQRESPIFYTCDLDQEAALKGGSTFRAWGRRGADNQ